MDEQSMANEYQTKPAVRNRRLTEPNKQSPIAQGTMSLQKAVAIAQDEMNSLLDVLQPVLSPVEQTDNGDNGVPEPPQSDLASLLMRETEKLMRLSKVIHNIRNRVEL